MIAAPMDQDLVSILIPCLNEEHFIAPCLESVLAFTRPPGVTVEVLVIDGGSTDRTRTIIGERFGGRPDVRVVANPRRTQAFGLNLGIREAHGGWVMRLDAHSLYPRDYLSRCYETALRTGADNTGGLVITEPGDCSYQASLVQALTTHRFGVGDSEFRTGAKEGPADTVPFGFFRREIFSRIGTFDERLVRTQDYEFNRRILRHGGKVWLNPFIQVRYFNQRSLTAFYRKQLFLEAPYNAYLWYVAPYAFTVRHCITAIFTVGTVAGALLAAWSRWLALVYFGVLTLYFLIAVVSAIQQAARFRRPAHVFLLPGCFFGFHFLHGLGVWGGIIRLLTRTAPVQN